MRQLGGEHIHSKTLYRIVKLNKGYEKQNEKKIHPHGSALYAQFDSIHTTNFSHVTEEQTDKDEIFGNVS